MTKVYSSFVSAFCDRFVLMPFGVAGGARQRCLYYTLFQNGVLLFAFKLPLLLRSYIRYSKEYFPVNETTRADLQSNKRTQTAAILENGVYTLPALAYGWCALTIELTKQNSAGGGNTTVLTLNACYFLDKIINL